MVIIGSVAVVLAVVFWGVWNLVLKLRERKQHSRTPKSLPQVPGESPGERESVAPAATPLRQDDRPEFRRDRPAA